MKFFPTMNCKSNLNLIDFTNSKILIVKIDFRNEIVGSTAEAITSRFDFAQLRQSYCVWWQKSVFLLKQICKTASKKSQLIWKYPKNAENPKTKWHWHVIPEEIWLKLSYESKANALEGKIARFVRSNLAGTITNQPCLVYDVP